MQTQTVKLLDQSSNLIEAVSIRADKHLPKVILWGVFDRRKVFFHERGSTYRECSWMDSPMPYPLGI
jgi:hypothetical protein